MGIFRRRKTVRIEGTIARIGVVRVSDLSLEYGFTLVGDPTRYVASAYPLRAEWDLALAVAGDHVGFLVTDTHPGHVHGEFQARAAD